MIMIFKDGHLLILNIMNQVYISVILLGNHWYL